jgi:hypothetical protein
VCKYDNSDSFPTISANDPSLIGLGFDVAIYGELCEKLADAFRLVMPHYIKNHMSSKNIKLGELIQPTATPTALNCAGV